MWCCHCQLPSSLILPSRLILVEEEKAELCTCVKTQFRCLSEHIPCIPQLLFSSPEFIPLEEILVGSVLALIRAHPTIKSY